jgi:hypothetical protein
MMGLGCTLKRGLVGMSLFLIHPEATEQRQFDSPQRRKSATHTFDDLFGATAVQLGAIY